MRILLPVFAILLISLVGLSFLQSKQLTFQNPKEPTVASWGDGTDAFYRQVLSSDGNFIENAGKAVFDNRSVQNITKEETENIFAQAKQEQKLAFGNSNDQVLGLHTAPDGSEKWIEVDLTNFKLYAWEGNRKVYEFSISTGRPGYETPSGEYRVWRKVRSQRYKGGIPGTGGYYDLPNVPYSLFFGGNGLDNWKGYAIHGAYWHNDFGIKNRSSGCVNLRPVDAGKLYLWAGPVIPEGVGAVNSTADNPGVRVFVHK